jgi:hypothetical protein
MGTEKERCLLVKSLAPKSRHLDLIPLACRMVVRSEALNRTPIGTKKMSTDPRWEALLNEAYGAAEATWLSSTRSHPASWRHLLLAWSEASLSPTTARRFIRTSTSTSSLNTAMPPCMSPSRPVGSKPDGRQVGRTEQIINPDGNNRWLVSAQHENMQMQIGITSG